MNRYPIRYNQNSNRFPLADGTDRRVELARLDELIELAVISGQRKTARWAKQRRRKVSGWVIGA